MTRESRTRESSAREPRTLLLTTSLAFMFLSSEKWLRLRAAQMCAFSVAAAAYKAESRAATAAALEGGRGLGPAPVKPPGEPHWASSPIADTGSGALALFLGLAE